MATKDVIQIGTGKLGRPKTHADKVHNSIFNYKDVYKLTRADFELAMHDTMDKTADDLKKIVRNPHNKARDMILASALLRCIQKGDIQRLEWFFNKIFE